jgi:hypothetical protein
LAEYFITSFLKRAYKTTVFKRFWYTRNYLDKNGRIEIKYGSKDIRNCLRNMPISVTAD